MRLLSQERLDRDHRLQGLADMKIIYRDQEWQLKGKTSVRRAIKAIGLNPEAVLAVLNDELVTDDRIVAQGDTLKLIAVVSGG